MAEILLQPDMYTDNTNPEMLESLDSRAMVEDIEHRGIILDDKEGLVNSVDFLRSEFGIEDTAFEDPRNTLLLVAVANHFNISEKNNLSPGQSTAEKEYVADLVMGVLGSFTHFKDQAKSLLETKNLSDEASRAVYDRFTQPEVTKDMEDFIRGEAFDSIRSRLGITQEEDFEVRVLSLADEGGSQFHGVDPGIDWESIDTVDYEELSQEQGMRNRYLEGLISNGKDFNEAFGREGSFASAWVTTFEDGPQYLCLSLPTAEKVLYTDEARARYYDGDDYTRDLALVHHEYTHTQRMLVRGSIGLGIGLEELRAEHFSNDRHGYIDIKGYFQGMKMLTGYSPKQSFEINGNPYDEQEFLSDIARNVGLQGLLESITVIPKNYVQDEGASRYIKDIVAHNGGGLDNHFQGMYERVVNEYGKEAVDANVSKFVDSIYNQLKDMNSTISVESWFAYRGIGPMRDIAIENFRRRYPDQGDGYNYTK